MKRNIFLLMIIIILLSCSRTNTVSQPCNKENSDYKLLIDNNNLPNLILTNKDKEIMQMNFFADGSLASILITDNDRGFNMVINFNQRESASTCTIDSFSFYDELSGYSNSSSYNNGDNKLIRIERFDKLLAVGNILGDGSATFTTSIIE